MNLIMARKTLADRVAAARHVYLVVGLARYAPTARELIRQAMHADCGVGRGNRARRRVVDRAGIVSANR